MMSSTDRLTLMTERLKKAFSPIHLEIVDDGHQHVGHAGNQGRAGYYTVIIQADALQGLSRVKAHQAVYGVLGDLIPAEIHALSIHAYAPHEIAPQESE